jgi:prophage antirepressor-like protein
MVVASTASPYKFAADVCASLGLEKPADDLDALDMLVKATATEIPYPLRGIADRTVRFTETVKAEDMLKAVKAYID